MTTKQGRRYPNNLLLVIVCMAALVFFASLLFTIKKDVFFSGDAGLKYLVLKQISKNGNYSTLQLEAASWVSDIWSQGFYPFKSPFVYDRGAGKIVAFPPAFQWVNSFFFAWFGYKGIYIIPAASIIVLWCWFIIAMRKARVPASIITAGLLLLALASPLTIYGAIYWEHSFAVLLIFPALVFILQQPSIKRAIMPGILSGMAVWFRPEMLVLCLLFMSLVLFNHLEKKHKANLAFLGLTLTGIVSFFVFNSSVYGNILGAHSFQLSNEGGVSTYLREKLVILTHINIRQLLFFPLTSLVFVLAIYRFFKKPQLPPLIFQLTVIIILFSLITPFVLPNAGGKQWGPRYFLPLIPVVVVTLCLFVNHVGIKRLTRSKWMILIVPLVLYSVYLNTVMAHKYLEDDYALRVKPGLDFLNSEKSDVVVVQNQYIAQEYAALFGKKRFFLAENQQQFNELQRLLKNARIPLAVYMASDGEHKMLPDNKLTGSRELKQVGGYFVAEYSLE